MSLASWWTARHEKKASRYLQQHPLLALAALRKDPLLASSAVRTMFELDARKSAPDRDTATFPTLGPWGSGSTQPLQQSLPKAVPANIRRFSEIPPARRAINALRDPILDLPFTIELVRPVGNKAHATAPEPTAEQQQRIAAVTQMLRMPNNDCTWRQLLSMMLEDLLVFGACPTEVQDNHSDERPLFLWPVDAQSIRINAAWQPGDSGFRYSQGRGYYSGALGSPDLIKLTDTELMMPRLNPRASTPFGLGYCEVAFETINSYIGATEYAARRASNNTPNFGLFLGENVTIDQARQWQHYWENEIEGYGKVPIIGGGKQPSVFTMTGTGQDQLYLAYQELLIRVIAMSFGISPMRLGLERDVNRSTSETSQDSDWMSIQPVANLLRDSLTHWLLWYRMGYYDLEFTWQVRTADELKQAEILALQWNSNSIFVDEVRAVYERPPLDDGLGQMTKTAYEAAIKAFLTQTMGPQQPGDTRESPTPLDEDKETLSPQEAAFVREVIRGSRQERYGLRAVAG